jgi:cyanophycinase-like exopeptidase
MRGCRAHAPRRRSAIGFAFILGLSLALGVGLGVAQGVIGRSFLARKQALGGSALGYSYSVVGNPGDVAPRTRPGFVLEGGGTDIDEAFRWLIERSGGGDFVVLRTTGTDAYNGFVYGMTAPGGVRADSVATLILNSREGSFDPFVARTIRGAEALWLAGGDQALHHARWRGTPVADAIHDLVARGVPVGGTSSGLAVMGEYAYTGEGDAPEVPHLSSTAVLRDPDHPRVRIRGDFLRLPFLAGTLLEPHFVQQSRYGRMAVFLGRIAAGGRVREARGLGIDWKTALLVEPDGSARVITHADNPYGRVVLLRAPAPADVPRAGPGHAPRVAGIEAREFRDGDWVDLREWGGAGGTAFRLSVEAGMLDFAALKD